MILDYHNHTMLCGHASGTMEEYIENAIARGIGDYGFSEHSPWMIQSPGEWLAMTDSDLNAYIEAVYALQRRYNREGTDPFHIRLGIEMDFVPSRLERARQVSEEHDWDYRLGSIHHLGLWNFQKIRPINLWGEHRVDDIYECYFNLMERMIDARFCEIISHLDVIKKFGDRPEGGYLHLVEPLIPKIAQSGMAVEINTSGRDREIAEFYPSWEIVERLIEANVPLTLGSDSHKPEDVGRYLPEAIAGLRERGARQIFRFEKRRMIPVEI